MDLTTDVGFNKLDGSSKLNVPVGSIISLWNIYMNELQDKFIVLKLWILKMLVLDLKFFKLFSYMIPTDPAVKPTARKKTNSNKSLGKELTIKFSWVI